MDLAWKKNGRANCPAVISSPVSCAGELGSVGTQRQLAALQLAHAALVLQFQKADLVGGAEAQGHIGPIEAQAQGVRAWFEPGGAVRFRDRAGEAVGAGG